MVEKTLLDSGLTVITEYRPELPSFALSFSLRSGSRAETLHNNGIHHLIEHMLFKGSRKYDLKAIAELSDRLGGSLNAFTSKEITQFYLKSIDEKLPESLDLLTNIVMHATFPGNEFEKEKNVIIQEIKETDDNPETYTFEGFYEFIFRDNAIGYPIGGKENTVEKLTRDDVYAYYSDRYHPKNFVLGLAGNVTHEKLVDSVTTLFSQYPPYPAGDFSYKKPGFQRGISINSNPALKQVYAIMGFRGIPSISPLRYRFMVLNDILGAGMSSRLFQAIREEKGLAYTISSFPDAFLEDGIHLIYGITEPQRIDDYLLSVADEIIKLKKKGITQNELERAKDHIKSSFILGLESNVAKNRFNVNHELYFKKECPVREVLNSINGTTVEDIHDLVENYLDLKNVAVYLYGNVKNSDLVRFKLENYQ